jgi:hypothetical protein
MDLEKVPLKIRIFCLVSVCWWGVAYLIADSSYAFKLSTFIGLASFPTAIVAGIIWTIGGLLPKDSGRPGLKMMLGTRTSSRQSDIFLRVFGTLVGLLLGKLFGASLFVVVVPRSSQRPLKIFSNPL